HPSYATAHENLGDIYAQLASRAYDRALQLDKNNATAQTKLAMVKELFSSQKVAAAAPKTEAPKIEPPPPKVEAPKPEPRKAEPPPPKVETVAKASPTPPPPVAAVKPPPSVDNKAQAI